jgi:threonylcarbamoyladenosine tRNA methylthiotransferase MtaB
MLPGGTMRVYLGSLGCKLNQSEIETLAGQLVRTGHQVVASPAEADLCILNTCAVTHVAAQKSRQAMRRLHRENPDARLVATGCYAELTPAELGNLPGVEFVVGNRDKERLVDLLDGSIDSLGVRRGSQATSLLDSERPGLPRPLARTRAFVKIQDGCDNACTYCIIHVARGPQRSRLPDQVLDDVRGRLAAGHKEIVLTGVHIGAYGRDREGDLKSDLWDLVTCILSGTAVPRLRLSSIEPWDLPEWALGLWEDPRLCRHLHLPLQSGCDAILHRMNRHYTTADFAARIAAARASIPDLAVTTDVIVGFPGESEAEFAESLSFVQSMGFARVHVFPYSVRASTPAARMSGQVPAEVKAERARILRAAAAERSRAFRQKFVGRSVEVLWESVRPGKEGPTWSGLTDNYLRVYAASGQDLANRLAPAHLVALDHDRLIGDLGK